MRVKHDPMIGILIAFDPDEMDLGVSLLYMLSDILEEGERGTIIDIAHKIEAKEAGSGNLSN